MPAQEDWAFDFHACDYRQLNNVLADIDWDSEFDNRPLEEILPLFYDRLNAVINDHVPKRLRRSSSSFNKPWWTLELRNLRNSLRKSRKHFFRTRSENDRSTLREMETSYKVLLSSTYCNYISRIQANVKEDPRRFWNFVNHQKNLQWNSVNRQLQRCFCSFQLRSS